MKANEMRKAYKKLYSEIEGILFRHDIVGIAAEENKNEYNIEAGAILQRMKEADSQEAVEDIVFDEFLKWFSKEAIPKRINSKYREVAKEVWDAWQKADI